MKTSDDNFRRVTASQLKRTLARENLSGIALDIDDTLSYTDHHWIEQMRARFGNPENLTREEIVKRYKYIEAVPYWRSRGAKKLMRELTHSNEFQEKIPIIEDSSHVLQKINKITPIIAYITARPSSVHIGTARWLKKHGFPAAPIIFRPLRAGHNQKISWKASVLKFLYPRIYGIIDDNPYLAEELKNVKYKGVLYLYDSGQNTKIYGNVLRCKNWSEVYELVVLNTKSPKKTARSNTNINLSNRLLN